MSTYSDETEGYWKGWARSTVPEHIENKAAYRRGAQQGWDDWHKQIAYKHPPQPSSWTSANSGSTWYSPAQSKGTELSAEEAGYVAVAVGSVIALAGLVQLVIAYQDEIVVLLVGTLVIAIASKLWLVFIDADSALLTKSVYVSSIVLSALAVVVIEYLLLSSHQTPGVLVRPLVQNASQVLSKNVSIAATELIGTVAAFIAFFLASNRADLMRYPLVVICIAAALILGIATYQHFTTEAAKHPVGVQILEPTVAGEGAPPPLAGAAASLTKFRALFQASRAAGASYKPADPAIRSSRSATAR